MIDLKRLSLGLGDRRILAAEWENKGNIVNALGVRCFNACDCITLATMGCVDAESSVSFWRQQGVAEEFECYVNLRQRLHQTIAPGTKGANTGSSFHSAAIAGLGWLLGKDDHVKNLLKIANSEIEMKRNFLFWDLFIQEMRNFSELRASEPRFPKLTPLMQHQKLYVLLMINITGRDVAAQREMLSRIEKSFLERNKDGSLDEDPPITTGTAENPVKWDFWKSTIMEFDRRRNVNTLGVE